MSSRNIFGLVLVGTLAAGASAADRTWKGGLFSYGDGLGTCFLVR